MDFVDQVFHFSLTDVGVKRSHNQDALGISMAPRTESFAARGHLFIVADGMGAHAVGELASKLAVDTIQHVYSKRRDLEPAVALRQALIEANQTIHEKGRQNREFQGMGTTATALLLLPDGARVGHVGDSRCYRIRGERIEQLSFDHSLQWELARKQKVSPEQLSSVPSNIIVRSLGPQPTVKVDLGGPYDLRDGDRFLLCSDGLSGPVSDREIWAVVTYLPGKEACQFLVDLANLRGGIDNITCVLVQLGEEVRETPPTLPEIPRHRPGAPMIWKRIRQLPLPYWFLFTGFSMSALGYFLSAIGVTWYLYAASMGVILLAAALCLLIFRRHREEKKKMAAPPPPPPVYRVQQCGLERPFVETLAKSEHIIHELAVDQQWKLNWSKLNEQKSIAEEYLKHDRLSDAFIAYCRALSLLSIGMRERRDKHEEFKPNWQDDVNSI